MSDKIAKNICRYAQDRGHAHLRLEKQGSNLMCVCGQGPAIDYLRLDATTENSIIETFRSLVGAADKDLFTDKRFKITDHQQIISGRATLLPASAGEKLIITLSSSIPQQRRLSALGLSKSQRLIFDQGLKRKSGVIIITAAAENGATSTYYSLLSALSAGRSTYSLEDYPVKIIEGVNTINLKKYNTVATALHKLLLIDSEIIGIDATLSGVDLKNIWQAARSGRLLIITLPAATAAAAIKYLRQAGLKPTDIAAQTIFISAQKLFPRPCTGCLRPFAHGPEIKQLITNRWPLASSLWPKKLYHNRGCRSCQQAKKDAKTAVFEIMRFLPDGRLRTDYQPLIQNALYKAGLGLIDIEDIGTWASSHQKI